MEPIFSDEPTVRDELDQTLREMLPWLTSAAIHIGIIVLTIFIVVMTVAPPKDDNPVIPHFYQPPQTKDILTGPAKPTLDPNQDQRHVKSEQPASKSIPKTLGVAGSIGPIIVAPPSTPSNDIRGNTDTGGSMFDPATFAAPQPASVVYVIDASGSLITEMGWVVDELKRSIRRLHPNQKFTVLFFQRDVAIEAPPRGLKPATPENCKRISDWVTLSNGNIVPGGASNPLAALRVALRYRPEAIFLLSDNITSGGRYEIDRGRLLAELKRMNASHATSVNTIQFLYPDPLGTLAEIARENGGQYRFVSEGEQRITADRSR